MTASPATAPATAVPAATGARGARAAWIMLASGWSANQFSALLGAYRGHLGLTESTTTGLFAVYVVGLIPALLIAGPLADRSGRRRVALSALALNVLSTLLLMTGGAWGLTWLLLSGRFLTGVSAGALLAAGSAWIKELSNAPRRSGMFVSAGFATGGLAAALIAQWAPWPMVTAYVPHVVLGAAAGLLAWAVPETAGSAPTHSSGAAHAHNSHCFRRTVLPLAPWAFAATTIGFVTLPSTLHTGLILTGVATAVVPGTGLLTARRARSTPTSGLLVVAAGTATAAVAAATESEPLALLAAIVLGAGYGLALAHGLTRTAALAPPHRLARWTALFWTVTYLGMFTPYVLTLLGHVTTTPVLLAAVTLLALAHAGFGAYQTVRPTRHRTP
ncbi:MFS transporter [Streptomyces sp. RY43-2]|uniref:MFS transporter n=1 Tax=Streptomyces macrolidinus TaxID=2952607 RepID=A0ABT0ZKF3_9ACTN|nr:MFS transporter [Streptomyces macrolidinus]MCN9244079.1 MFS transporter [Streptomyces macrolidinus]